MSPLDKIPPLPAGNAPPAVEPHFPVHLARAFSCFFWGLLFLAVTASQNLVIRTAGATFSLWWLGVGVLMFGTWTAWHTRYAAPAWRPVVRRLAWWTAAGVLLLPFSQWWSQSPHNNYFTFNIVLLFFAAQAFLHEINRLAWKMGSLFDDPAIRFEARLGCWAVVLLGILPGAVLTLMAGILFAGQTGSFTNAFTLFIQAINPRWLALPLLPASLTLVVMWRAKQSCFYMLTRRKA